MIPESDYPALRRAMLRAILAHEARLGESAAQYRDAIVQAVAANGYALDRDGRELVSRYIDEVDTAIRAGLGAAVAPLAQAGRLGSEWIATQVADAYSRRWPDGLTLSRRVWAWGEDVRRGVSAALTEGVRLERSAGQLVYDLQRAIEATSGARFAIAATAVEDWAERLVAAGRRSVRERMGMTLWTEAVEEARRHLETLADGGTRRQARVAFERIVAGITAGREDLTERALNWWIYDRQLYKLRRIVRTEMSTAYHRGVIAASREDADVVGYRWQLSASHPRPDICDYYADVDFGLGAGVWPKDNVPADKAHPHCLCSLTPTTRTMRKDGRRGATSLDDFLARVSPEMRERLSPRWAQDLMALGVPAGALKRADGLWFSSREAVIAQMGPERFAAAQAIGRARRERDWGLPLVKPGSAMGRETFAALRDHQDDPVCRDVLATINAHGGRARVSGRDLHYVRRKYLDGENLASAADLDRRFNSLIDDGATQVREARSGEARRWVLYSVQSQDVAVVDDLGRRVTFYRLRADRDPQDLGDLKWTIGDLRR